MSLADSIKQINQSAQKIHGQDIRIVVARAIHFGNDDNLVIISGKNHKAAALDFARVIKGCKIVEENHPEMDWGDGEVFPAYSNSRIYF